MRQNDRRAYGIRVSLVLWLTGNGNNRVGTTILQWEWLCLRYSRRQSSFRGAAHYLKINNRKQKGRPLVLIFGLNTQVRGIWIFLPNSVEAEAWNFGKCCFSSGTNILFLYKKVGNEYESDSFRYIIFENQRLILWLKNLWFKCGSFDLVWGHFWKSKDTLNAKRTMSIWPVISRSLAHTIQR